MITLCPRRLFPVFAATCSGCGKASCLDCAALVAAPKAIRGLFTSVPRGFELFAFACPGCGKPFPPEPYPINLLIYEDKILDLDLDRTLGDPKQAIRLFGYDVSHGPKAMLTVGLPGVMPIRCSRGDGS